MTQKSKSKYRYFVLSFLLSFALLSVLLYALMRVARPNANPAPVRELAPAAPAYLPTREDSLSVLFVGLDPAGSGADTFLLAKFDPAGGKVPIAVFPRETAVTNHGKAEPLTEVYRYGGAEYLRARMAESLGVTIDRYVRMDTAAFTAAADTVGAVEFLLPDSLTTGDAMPVTLAAGLQLLDGAAAASIMQYEGYAGGETERCAMAADLAAAAVNQRMDVVLSALLDNVFETVINLIDTDISYADYDDRKEAAIFLAKLGQDPAKPLYPEGTYSEDGTLYTLSDTFVARLTQEFV